MNLQDDGYCFACGENNPIGLRLRFDFADGEASTKFTPGKQHQGWNNVVHGGLLFTLMDEAMAKLIIHEGDFAVTSNMETRFLRPAIVGEELTVTAEITRREGRKIHAGSKIFNSKGKIVASGRGTYVAM